MNIIQKIGFIVLAIVGVILLIFINAKRKAKALASEAENIVSSNRRKLANNEKRYYGKPYSAFDLIKTTDTLIEVNRKRYLFKDGSVEMIVTSDPDETNGWGSLVAKHEVYFTKSFELIPDSRNGINVKGFMSVKSGIIYQAKIHSNGGDDMAGLIIKNAEGVEVFYIAFDGQYLNAESLKK